MNRILVSAAVLVTIALVAGAGLTHVIAEVCIDLDGDGYGSPADPSCPSGPLEDCDDADAAVHPLAAETCDGRDDNCDGLVDEDALGLDTDGDGVANSCDNCRSAYNPAQLDFDGDGHGNSCDDCPLVPNPDQADLDRDGHGDACDNCPTEFNPAQADFDLDGFGDACDGCPFDFENDADGDRICASADNCDGAYNPDQSDADGDLEGDACDLDDGTVFVHWEDALTLTWQQEAGFTAFDLYRGDVAALVDDDGDGAAEGYGSCLATLLTGVSMVEGDSPPTGTAYFYIVAGVDAAGEGSLGTASSGVERLASTPCQPFPFGRPPVIETVLVEVVPESFVACDFTLVVVANLCARGVPDVIPDRPIVISGQVTEVRMQTRVTDPDGAGDVLLVGATFSPGSNPGSEMTLVMFDDGSTNQFNLTQRFQTNGLGEACVYEPGGICACQTATYRVDSNDVIAADSVFTRNLPMVTENALSSPTGQMFQDCIMRERRQAPFAAIDGETYALRFDAVDRRGNLATWPEIPRATVSTTTFNCDGDACGCCWMLSSDPATECADLPGLRSPDFPNGLCVDGF